MFLCQETPRNRELGPLADDGAAALASSFTRPRAPISSASRSIGEVRHRSGGKFTLSIFLQVIFGLSSMLPGVH
jgi:hypothetical protein